MVKSRVILSVPCVVPYTKPSFQELERQFGIGRVQVDYQKSIVSPIPPLRGTYEGLARNRTTREIVLDCVEFEGDLRYGDALGMVSELGYRVTFLEELAGFVFDYRAEARRHTIAALGSLMSIHCGEVYPVVTQDHRGVVLATNAVASPIPKGMKLLLAKV